MAVTLTQSPTQKFDLTYGPNPVTLTGIGGADKYVLQIVRNGTIIADVRQTPNTQGYAIFDIQNVLQTQVGPSKPNIEQTGFIGTELSNAQRESLNYAIWVGTETAGTVVIDNQYPSDWVSFGGTKQYYEVPFSPGLYIPIVSQSGTLPVVVQQGQPFTDRVKWVYASEITDGKPTWLLDNMKVYLWDVTPQDMTTITYYNGVNGNPPAMVRGLGGFRWTLYNNNILLDTVEYQNIQSMGGGPNIAIADGTTISYPYNAISVGTGPKNFQDFDPSATHYYVSAGAYDPASTLGVGTDPMFYVHRFNIVDPACNDYEHYQFSWLNSYGFRDYYTFNKKKTRSVNITRNEFLKEDADYSASQYDVNTYDRGTTVYSQTLKEVYTAFTDYISDADASFLEGLYISADVKVRMGASTDWWPISLISSNYTEKTSRQDKLFQYEITFKQANNLKSQRG